MLFAIDIDGTVAGQLPLVLIEYLNRELDLRLPENRLASFASSSEFLCSPEVQHWLASNDAHQEQYDNAKRQSQYDPLVQQRCIALPGAVEGVQRLAECGRIIYVTYRRKETENLTREWLAQNHFPSPSSAYCCEELYDKPRHAFLHANEDEPVILIDDRLEGPMVGYRMLVSQFREARSLHFRLGFIAYGSQELDPHNPTIAPVLRDMPVRRLSDWLTLARFEQDLTELTTAIAKRQESCYAR